jgi:endonuclease/exonuclease/phosphatase family metal-dependent hydrolase
VRVATMNLWGRRGAWAERRLVLIDGLRKVRPDIISLQEAIKTVEYDQAADLLGPDFDIVYQRSPEPDGQSAAIATRFPVKNIRELDQRVTARVDSAATTLVAEILAPDPIGPLLFVNHLPSWQLDFALERELQASAAARFVEECLGQRDMHVILAGDLTDPPESASVRLWSGRQSLHGTSVCFRDAWESAHRDDPGDTYTPRNPILADWDWPFQRLDYVFVRCGAHGGPTLAISSCIRIFDEPLDGVWASDHFGVVADLEIPTPRLPPPPNLPAEG